MNIESVATTVLSVGMTAVVVALILERISEWICTKILDSLYKIITGKEKMETETKFLVISTINFSLYLAFLRYNFIGPLLLQLKIETTELAGVLLSAIVVAGGSNLVNGIFSIVDNRKS